MNNNISGTQQRIGALKVLGGIISSYSELEKSHGDNNNTQQQPINDLAPHFHTIVQVMNMNMNMNQLFHLRFE